MNLMKTLLTIPENLIEYIRSNYPAHIYPAADPREGKVGSGGGTANLLYSAYLDECCKGRNISTENNEVFIPSFFEWLGKEKRIIIHAGGQGRRLPAYAPLGKILAPIPVFRWERGQRMDQTLFDLQQPILEEILEKAPKNFNTLIASGDALIRAGDRIPAIPQADVVCIGLWEQPQKASNHGVFFCKRTDPGALEFMLQKPARETIQELAHDYLFLIDVGIWLLSDRAARILIQQCGWDNGKNGFSGGYPSFYDLYGSFGLALGQKPTNNDPGINDLSVAIVPLPKGEFYHFGTSAELIDSTTRLQNLVVDQREILHNKIKPHPSLFTQNALTNNNYNKKNHSIWIENAVVPDSWSLSERNIVTGVPDNHWKLRLSAGICLDVIPLQPGGWCIRPYGFEDAFYGKVYEDKTRWMSKPVTEWFNTRKIEFAELAKNPDIQFAPLFPVLETLDETTGDFIQWMVDEYPTDSEDFRRIYRDSLKLSAAQISEKADISALADQRRHLRDKNLAAVAKNYRHSIFYQLDLNHTAQLFNESGIPLPPQLPEQESLMIRVHDQMFRSMVTKDPAFEKNAFALLRTSIIESVRQQPVLPNMKVHSDQIAWGRSPVRLDLAGGWTDTPPFCMIHGGKVVNMAIELNGQPPLQCFIKPSAELKIILRSIDLSARDDIYTYDALGDYAKVGASFAISKAALCLSGFHPDFCAKKYDSLEEQLKELGAGIEITLLSAVPKGSGLGTSSILASTVLATISDMFGLLWDKEEICVRTLALEQMLTTGGGWQDQYGGVFEGIKLLESEPGLIQKPKIRYAWERLFTEPGNAGSVLLYYTGITRIAKSILAEIVRGMFLNNNIHLSVLKEMKLHALETYDVIQQGQWSQVAQKIALSWQLNQRLDNGTNTPEIQEILEKISDLTLGCKLLGAGGGGYMMIISKEPEAASRIRHLLTLNPPNNRARFVDWRLSELGLQVTRS